MKIVIGHKPGLLVCRFKTHGVAQSISVASSHLDLESTGNEFLLRLRSGSNIVFSTPNERVAKLIFGVNSLTIRGQQYAVNTYVSTLEFLLKGVLHNVTPGSPESELMANLRVRTQGVTIRHARMIGKSQAAVILFDGTRVRSFVYYRGAEIPCCVYQPIRQFCHMCRKIGRRGDVCPFPTPACVQCNGTLTDTNSTCKLHCALCGEAHFMGVSGCRNSSGLSTPRAVLNNVCTGRAPVTRSPRSTVIQLKVGGLGRPGSLLDPFQDQFPFPVLVSAATGHQLSTRAQASAPGSSSQETEVRGPSSQRKLAGAAYSDLSAS